MLVMLTRAAYRRFRTLGVAEAMEFRKRALRPLFGDKEREQYKRLAKGYIMELPEEMRAEVAKYPELDIIGGPKERAAAQKHQKVEDIKAAIVKVKANRSAPSIRETEALIVTKAETPEDLNRWLAEIKEDG